MTSINESPINHITSPSNNLIGGRVSDYSLNEFNERNETTTMAANTCGDPNHSKSSQSSSRNSPVISCATDDSDSREYEEIGKFFETKTIQIEKWLREHASYDVLAKIHNAIEHAKVQKRQDLRASSITSDLFQQWIASSPNQVCTHSTQIN